MPKPTDVTILSAQCSFETIPFRSPLKFGGRVMDKSTLINVSVRVETRNKRQEEGFGSMPVGSVWAWPSSTMSIAQTEEAMQRFAEAVVELAADFPDHDHPLDFMLQCSAEFPHLAKQLQQK